MIQNISNEDLARLNSCVDRLNSICNYKTAAITVSNLFLEKDKKIVIYGAGLHTKKLFEYFDKKHTESIVAIADANKAGGEFCGFNVISTSEINDLEFDFIVLSSDINQSSMTKELLNSKIDSKKIIDIYKLQEFYSFCAKQQSENIDLIASKINSSKNPLIIVGLSFQLNHIALFDALSKYYSIYALCLSENLSQSINIKDIGSNYEIMEMENANEIFTLISMINTGNVLNICGWKYMALSAGIIKYANVSVFCMVVDVLSSMFKSEEEVVELFGEQARDDWFCEQFCWKYSDGYIHKDNSESLSRLKTSNAHNRHLNFLQYTNNIKLNKSYKNNSKPSIVFAGGIHSISDNNDSSIFHKSFLKLVQIITSQGYSISAYNAYDNGLTNKWSEYIEESNKNALFNYYFSVDINSLVSEISQYDIAISVYDYDLCKTDKLCLDNSFSTRIVAYIEAELPIIHSKEMTFTTKFIEDNGVGIGVSFNDMHDLKCVIDRMNIDNYNKNLKILKEKMSYENNIHKLIDFMNRENR